MIKTFKYKTDSKDTFGVNELGLKKGDIFQWVDTRLSFIEKEGHLFNVYHYEYLINIPKGCYFVNQEEWIELIICSEFVDSK